MSYPVKGDAYAEVDFLRTASFTEIMVHATCGGFQTFCCLSDPAIFAFARIMLEKLNSSQRETLLKFVCGCALPSPQPTPTAAPPMLGIPTAGPPAPPPALPPPVTSQTPAPPPPPPPPPTTTTTCPPGLQAQGYYSKGENS